MVIKGIDVSRWQGDIDWFKVKSDGVEFAIIKAGGSDAGCYTDSKWSTNYEGAKTAGMPIGAYYFVGQNCTSAEAGRADAHRFLKQLDGKQFEYPVYIDCEAPSPSDKKGTTDAVIAFCETMESAGYFTGIYGSAISGFVERMDDSRLSAYTHWVAQYGSRCTYTGEYGIWQYSSLGWIDGIQGNVDMNYCFVDYPSIIISKGFNGYGHPSSPPTHPKAENLDAIALEVIKGMWGNGAARKTALIKAGYDYSSVQQCVNHLLKEK